MMFLRLLLCTALILQALCWGPSAGGGGRKKSHNYDLSGQALKDLYNSKVQKAEAVWRPFKGKTKAFGPFYHSGVRVTLDDDSQWLIHKGKDQGHSSETVVVNAKHMSSAWKETGETTDFHGRKTVSDFVRRGGRWYNFLFSNCHIARRRMMNQKP